MQKSFPPIILFYCIFLLFPATGCSEDKTGEPILLLTGNKDFGAYTGEILKAEGFNEFITDSIESKKISGSFLAQFDLIILAEKTDDRQTSNMLRKYVRGGGNLIVFQPDKANADLFGLEKMTGKTGKTYIAIDTSSAEGRSLTGKKIQIHVTAEGFSLKTGKAVAWFCNKTDSVYEFPAVVTNSFGKGQATAFLYDLPRNIAYTRQGNPESAGIEKDSIPGIRAMDLFTDGWVDTSNNVINQADEQMILLTHCIEQMNGDMKPLPRLWYYPDSLKCLVTLTNDGEFNNENDFERQFRDIDSMGAIMSLYIMETARVSKLWAEKWTARGFEISGHPDDTREAKAPVWSNMDRTVSAKISEINDIYGLRMSTVVNHWFVWCGNNESGDKEFSAQAEIEAKKGLSMDVNYAHYDNNSGQGHFLGPQGSRQGNFTGSGLPMRFAGSSGKIIDIYQHLNNVYDQQYNENHDSEGFYNCFKGLMDRSLNNEVYSLISIKSHNDEYYFSRGPLIKMLAYAANNGIPVWTVSELSEFTRMRDEASFSSISFSGNKISFDLHSSLKHNSSLTVMIPFNYRHNLLKSIRCNGNEVAYTKRSVRGYDYAFLTVEPGTDYSFKIAFDN
ncbi:MAG TPA: hypothetical protein DEO60_07200 [Bacteroidales bacterium]|nr:hypothetical protein [Bacteroidales bacterium]HBZ20895.1 hypothetical protein [Bacteroidales bacterium]